MLVNMEIKSKKERVRLCRVVNNRMFEFYFEFVGATGVLGLVSEMIKFVSQVNHSGCCINNGLRE